MSNFSSPFSEGNERAWSQVGEDMDSVKKKLLFKLHMMLWMF